MTFSDVILGIKYNVHTQTIKILYIRGFTDAKFVARPIPFVRSDPNHAPRERGNCVESSYLFGGARVWRCNQVLPSVS